MRKEEASTSSINLESIYSPNMVMTPLKSASFKSKNSSSRLSSLPPKSLSLINDAFNSTDSILCWTQISSLGWLRSMEVPRWLPILQLIEIWKMDYLMILWPLSTCKNCKKLIYIRLTGEEEQIGGFDLIYKNKRIKQSIRNISFLGC